MKLENQNTFLNNICIFCFHFLNILGLSQWAFKKYGTCSKFFISWNFLNSVFKNITFINFIFMLLPTGISENKKKKKRLEEIWSKTSLGRFILQCTKLQNSFHNCLLTQEWFLFFFQNCVMSHFYVSADCSWSSFSALWSLEGSIFVFSSLRRVSGI